MTVAEESADAVLRVYEGLLEEWPDCVAKEWCVVHPPSREDADAVVCEAGTQALAKAALGSGGCHRVRQPVRLREDEVQVQGGGASCPGAP